MRLFQYLFTLVLLITAFSSKLSYSQENTLTQISTLSALMQGNYGGSVSVAELNKFGGFGLGTFDALDGEMIILDNVCYKIKSDGTIVNSEMTEKIPFASVVDFQPEYNCSVSNNTDLKGLEALADSIIPGKNLFYALKIRGKFKLLTARSVPKQSKPYLPLLEVVKKQSEFRFENVEGTIVGFKCPAYVNGINVAGYHFHFISDDKKSGGHVLNFVLSEAKLQIDKITTFRMILPSDKNFNDMNLESDKSIEIKKVEGKNYYCELMSYKHYYIFSLTCPL